jgi:hypothetical protein
MEGSIAFPPSVAASEPAICAWSSLFDAAAGAPLPPLPVMVAALLRRPQLDVFIAAVACAAARRSASGPDAKLPRVRSAARTRSAGAAARC